MKKLILLIFLIPNLIYAKDYKINSSVIDITINNNGDAIIKEAISMNAPYNGYEKIINYKNYDGYIGSIISSTKDSTIYDISEVILNEIRGINYIDDFSVLEANGDLFVKKNSAHKGEYGVYTEDNFKTGIKYKIYNSSKMNKSLYLSYTLKDACVTHADVSECLLNLYEKESIKNLKINIHLDNTLLLDIYVHNLDYNKNIIDKSNIELNLSNINSKENIDFRLVFDKNNNFIKQTNEIVYDKIIKIEKELLDNKLKSDTLYDEVKSNAYEMVEIVSNSLKRDDYNNAYTAVSLLKETDSLKTELTVKLMNIESLVTRSEMMKKLFLTSIILLWVMGIVISNYIIYKKGFKKTNEKYDTNLNPYEIEYLLYKKVTKKSLISVLLKMIYDNKLEFKKMSGDNFSLKKKDVTYTNNELKVIKLLFKDKEEITANKLKSRVLKEYDSFIDDYSNWIISSINESENRNFYEELLFFKIFLSIYSIVGIIISVYLIKKDTFFSPHLMLLIAILSLIYYILLDKKTDYGSKLEYKFNLYKKALKKKQDYTKEDIIYSYIFKLNKSDEISDSIENLIKFLLHKAYKNKKINDE